MSLLRQIQEGATDHSVPLADLLRRCKILAKRLQHEPLAAWVEQELDGYTSADALPLYRRHRAEVRGDFSGSFHAELRNVPIPSLSVEENHRDTLFTMFYMEGVAHYEAIVQSGEKEFSAPWPADFAVVYAQRLIDGYNLVEARRLITRGMLEGMLDQIRNRILSFALEIEEQNPDAGEAEPKGEPPVAPEKVNQIFNTYVLGGPNIVASGSQNVIRDFKQVAGDWESLEEALKQLGLEESDVKALQAAVKQDGDSAPPGPAVKGWLGDVTARAASGSLRLANSAAGSAIATLVLHYLGAAGA